MQLIASVDHPETPSLRISPRLRSQIVYFMTPADQPGLPAIGENEYWIAKDDVTRWLSEGVLELISPLDTDKVTEVELTEEQESFLAWLNKHGVQHIRVAD